MTKKSTKNIEEVSAIDKMIALGKEQNKQSIVKTAEFIRDFDLEKHKHIKARY